MECPEMVPTCCYCGSADVRVDAWAYWDRARQEWRLGKTFSTAFCNNCEGETSLTDVADDLRLES